MTSIRPAVATDSAAVTSLAIAAFERYTERIGRPAMPMTLDYATAIADHKVWLAEVEPPPAVADAEPPPLALTPAGGPPLGFVLLEEQADALLLDVVAVAPDAQGQGVGSTLLAFAEEQARARGYSRIVLYTHEKMTENLAYYPRHGYTETHREEQHGHRRVHFAKPVPPTGSN
ncbi:GNAT family N-acetyltransferase [Kribbella sp. NPDC051620]|uniref:GNAT family N-acetyltransferase n=1 Tax=Kribbella sp. NPDC051620 TaxID=3364120 RepID=UPI0037A60B94